MSNVVSLLPGLHINKRRFVASIIVEKLVLNIFDDHLARAMNLPKGRSNRDVVFMMLDISYPSPTLAWEHDKDSVAEEVIGQMSIRCGMPL